MRSKNLRTYSKAATQYILELTSVIEDQNTDKRLIREFFKSVEAQVNVR